MLFVPVGSPLEVRTERDQIEVKGLKKRCHSQFDRRRHHHPLRARAGQRQDGTRCDLGRTRNGRHGGTQALSTETSEIEMHLWKTRT